MKIGILALRATIGGFFIGHGAQKLFGAQGGGGLKGTAQMFDSIGLKPAMAQATFAGVAETAGGAGLVLGYHTPLSAAAVVGSMTTAIQRVHGKNGWNVQSHGYEYNAVLIAGAVAVAEIGPGFLSLDALRGQQRSGLLWGLFALGAGVAGAAGSSAVAGYFGGEDPIAGVEPSGSSASATAPISDAVNTVEAIVESQGETLPVESLTDAPASGAPAREPLDGGIPANPEA